LVEGLPYPKKESGQQSEENAFGKDLKSLPGEAKRVTRPNLGIRMGPKILHRACVAAIIQRKRQEPTDRLIPLTLYG